MQRFSRQDPTIKSGNRAGFAFKNPTSPSTPAGARSHILRPPQRTGQPSPRDGKDRGGGPAAPRRTDPNPFPELGKCQPGSPFTPRFPATSYLLSPQADFHRESRGGPEGTGNRNLPSSSGRLLGYAKQAVVLLGDSFRQSLTITLNHWKVALMLLLKHLLHTPGQTCTPPSQISQASSFPSSLTSCLILGRSAPLSSKQQPWAARGPAGQLKTRLEFLQPFPRQATHGQPAPLREAGRDQKTAWLHERGGRGLGSAHTLLKTTRAD